MLFRTGPAKHWLDDTNFRIDRDALDRLIDPSEEQYLYYWTRRLRIYWLLIAGSLGGIPGGLLASHVVLRMPSWWVVAGLALAALTVLARFATLASFGRTMAARAQNVVLWGALIGAAAQIGGQIGPAEVGYVLSGALAGIAGYLYATKGTPWILGNSIWPFGAVVFAAAASCWGTYIVRYGPGDHLWVMAGLAGGCSAVAFFTGLFGFFSHHFDAAGGLRDLARVYMHNEATYRRAIDHLDEAIRLSPRDPELRSHRAVARSLAGDFAGAEADYQRLHQLLPKRAEPIMNRALDHMRKGDGDRALELILEARRLDPANALVHCNLGAIHDKRNEPEAAIAAYGRALELEPDYARAYSNRAYAHWTLGRYDEALRDSEAALRKNPRSAMAHVHRGLSLAGLGRTAEAADAFRAALEIGGEIGADEEARKGLAELGLAG